MDLLGARQKRPIGAQAQRPKECRAIGIDVTRGIPHVRRQVQGAEGFTADPSMPFTERHHNTVSLPQDGV
jgi:hypothetical protein